LASHRRLAASGSASSTGAKPAGWSKSASRILLGYEALRALGAKWLKIIFVMWIRHVPYDENYHLAIMARQQLRQLA
jgi:hypothetical protein